MIIQAAKRLQDVNEYYFSTKLAHLAQLQAQGHDIINLGIGNPDLPPSNIAINHLTQAAQTPQGMHGYQPYRGTPDLVKALKKWYAETYQLDNLSELDIVPLMGSKEGIVHISMAFLNAADAVLLPNPGYPTYASATNLVEAKAVNYHLKEENNWYPDFEELKKLVKKNKVKILWLNYPNMPTGALPKYQVFHQLVKFAQEHKILLVHDNPYSLILNENPMSIFCVKGAQEVAIELNSLSKSHNMAGWRVGMLVGRKDYVDTVMKVKTNFDSGMFKAIQQGAIGALQNSPDWHKLQNDTYFNRREIVFNMLDALNCSYSRNISGLFVWAKIPSTFSSGLALSDAILEKTNVFITPGFIFGSQGENYIRISLCINQTRLSEALHRIKMAQL